MSGGRYWGDTLRPDFLARLSDWLRDASPLDGACHTPRASWSNTPESAARMRDRDCIRDDLAHAGLTPGQAGLLADLSGVAARPPGDDALYDTDHAALARCSPRDFRVACGGSYGAGNHTVTEPVGVVVHEIRVRTVPADRHAAPAGGRTP